ncbi:MAG TPA: hypothetical protein VHC70_10610, partial [Phycisphaerales bacterium]|nr:hypothetical protein [Phycisphaerales bacterium]
MPPISTNSTSVSNRSTTPATPGENAPIGTAPAPTAGATPKSEAGMKLLDMLRTASDNDASDVHLVTGHVPMMRVHQVMAPMDFPVLTPELVRSMVEHMASKEAFAKFEQIKDSDFSYSAPGLARYRVNAHMQRGSAGIAMRSIKTKVPPLANLNLPEVIARLTYLPRGLVLVT